MEISLGLLSDMLPGKVNEPAFSFVCDFGDVCTSAHGASCVMDVVQELAVRLGIWERHFGAVDPWKPMNEGPTAA